jgi:GntR family transcriptional regulator
MMELHLDRKSPIPLHAQAETLLRQMMELPEYQNFKRFPNEIELSKLLGISRSTLRLAINKLVFEGRLVRKKGIGTTVANLSISTRYNNWLSFSQEMKAKGIEVKNFELHVSWQNSDDEVASFFGIEKSLKILELRRLRGKKDGPFVYFISYFNPRIGMTGDEDFTLPLYEILEKKYGIIAKLSKEEISARVADNYLAKKLELNPGDPVLVRKRFVYDKADQPIEFNMGYYRADSFVYTLESERS